MDELSSESGRELMLKYIKEKLDSAHSKFEKCRTPTLDDDAFFEGIVDLTELIGRAAVLTAVVRRDKTVITSYYEALRGDAEDSFDNLVATKRAQSNNAQTN